MIQAYYKYRPASLEALVLLVCADGKDRIVQMYTADMLRLIASARYTNLPILADIIRTQRKKPTAVNADAFVDDMLRVFGGGGER